MKSNCVHFLSCVNNNGDHTKHLELIKNTKPMSKTMHGKTINLFYKGVAMNAKGRFHIQV